MTYNRSYIKKVGDDQINELIAAMAIEAAREAISGLKTIIKRKEEALLPRKEQSAPYRDAIKKWRKESKWLLTTDYLLPGVGEKALRGVIQMALKGESLEERL